MDFTFAKPTPQFMNMGNEKGVKNSSSNRNQNEKHKIQVVEGHQKNISAKDAFINKYNLRELYSGLPNDMITYYYDSKSATLFELHKNLPIIFMKTDPDTKKRILEINGITS